MVCAVVGPQRVQVKVLAPRRCHGADGFQKLTREALEDALDELDVGVGHPGGR